MLEHLTSVHDCIHQNDTRVSLDMLENKYLNFISVAQGEITVSDSVLTRSTDVSSKMSINVIVDAEMSLTLCLSRQHK